MKCEKNIKIEQGDLKLLALYKIENELPTYSVAIRHAIMALDNEANNAHE